MAFWLVKTEPSTYSHADLVRDGATVWDGVKNPVALKHLAAMRPGDTVLVYHTGSEKAAVGLATVASAPYPDPKKKDPRLVVVQLAAGKPLARPVTLAEVKADRGFADFALARLPRLSVMPVTAEQWRRLLAMSRA
jgi:predicted RNA-binding protein with PUA-like domain